MLKHLDIIQQLSDSDKIHMICDIHRLEDRKYKVLGIPALHIVQLTDFFHTDVPSMMALSNSWDEALAESIANYIFGRLAEQGVDMVILPGPRMKLNPYRAAVAEDPLLAGSMTASFLRAAAQHGIFALLDGLSIHADEIHWLDPAPDMRLLQENLLQPYKDAASAPACKGILCAPDLTQQGWDTINSQLPQMLRQQLVQKECFFLQQTIAAEDTVRYLAQGGLCFHGSALALESALDRYKQLENSIAHGSSTAEELTAEELAGRAISPQTLDEIADRMLTFLLSAKRKPTVSTAYTDERTLQKALPASMVLLKNTGTLPLKAKSRLCLIGDMAMTLQEDGSCLADQLSDLLTGQGYQIHGTARGYDLSLERSDKLISHATNLAEQSDLALVFLGLDKRRQKKTHRSAKISLPANQQALLDQLENCKRKVIAILPPEGCPDIMLPENCSAIVLAPLDTKFSATALADVLCGKTGPAGKLASTLYCRSDELFTQHLSYKFRDGLKTGSFVGYRYYDTAQTPPVFPFGHGLSYCNFVYSHLSISDGSAHFTVTNRSKLAGTEIAQVYIQKSDSAILRPSKELAGFARIELKPGEKKTVQIPIHIPLVYDVPSDQLMQEAGNYKIFVGSSLENTPLSHNFTVDGHQLAPDGKNRSQYIQTESNIISDHFKLEANYKTMKKSVLHYVFGGVFLALAIVLKMYCAFTDASTAFFDIFSVILGLVGVVFLILEAINKHQLHSQERAKIDEASKQEFAASGAEVLPFYSGEQMFVKEFDTPKETIVAPTHTGLEGVRADLAAYIDKDQSFPTAIADFCLFAAERGCKFSEETVRDLFASLASSRLLVLRGMDENAFRKFMVILSSYFETSAYVDRVDTSYNQAESVLFHTDANGNRSKSNILLAIEAAQNSKHLVHFAALDHVIPEYLPQYFTPFVNYSKNPTGSTQITVTNQQNVDTSYHLPQNLWFVLNLKQGKLPSALPSYVSDVAVVNQFRFETCNAESQYSHVRGFSYYQLDYLAEKAINALHISEEHWKKIDRLEKYTADHTDFVIHNKTWLCLEKYLAVYRMGQGELLDALDRGICSKLMTPVITALQGQLSADDADLEDTLERILGEDWPVTCKKLVHDCSTTQV